MEEEKDLNVVSFPIHDKKEGLFFSLYIDIIGQISGVGDRSVTKEVNGLGCPLVKKQLAGREELRAKYKEFLHDFFA